MEKNVFGEELKVCCTSPMTGYFRDGSCRTISEDTGTHTVCAIMTDEFLNFSLSKGNNLITPIALSLIHISEPTRPFHISYAVFCL